MHAISTLAQTDSSQKKNPRIITVPKKKPNSTKLELVYKTVEYTGRRSNGSTYTNIVDVPFVRINDKKPVEIDRKGKLLMDYYSRCPQAQDLINKMHKQQRAGTAIMISGCVVGVVTAFSGLIASAGEGKSGSPFMVRFGIGAGVATVATFTAWAKTRKSKEYLHQSVDAYNANCYIPPVKDSTATPAPVITSATNTPVSPKKYYQDTILYELLRNEPAASGLSGISLHLANVDIGPNLNIGSGIGVFYTYRSLFGASLDYNYAFLDNMGDKSGNKGKPGPNQSWGLPASYRKANRLELRTKLLLTSWEKQSSYHVVAGTTKIGGSTATVGGRIKARKLKGITLRTGFQLDNRVMDPDNSGTQMSSFVTSTPPYQYHVDGQVEELSRNLSSSTAMLHSGIAAVGIGLSTFTDLKVAFKDETYKGRSEEKTQHDLYIDMLYAPVLKVEDMIFYQSLYEQGIHMPQRLDLSPTPLSRAGARLGYSVMGMNNHFGIRYNLELGIRPGIKGNNISSNAYLQITAGFIFGGRFNH
ncbi:hypothetical protein DF182_21410 [Chitinophaga flava]|uniref:Uncharacterized protein n=2 Tax=Chitinophaga flava TaxID=2259036 RepID=A0A365XRX3_9BACT|nr:hypothetical protein DF182_21410 [Chitinophaga flava]